jgi:hypothetical protein
MKKTLTQQDIENNPLLSDCAVGDVLTVKHKKDKGEVATKDDKPKPGEHPPPPNNP